MGMAKVLADMKYVYEPEQISWTIQEIQMKETMSLKAAGHYTVRVKLVKHKRERPKNNMEGVADIT